LPAIAAACGHARRNELRELLAQDQALAAPMFSAPFARASRQVGRLQLARLRPLRDERLVQRYLVAVESGQAYGWNAIVYGITLAVFSLPLRQGLLFYSQEVLSAFALAPGLSANLSDSDWASKLSILLDRLPAAVEAALAGDGGCVFSAQQPGELAPGV
jgi:urease accessory protein UreF